MAHISNSQIFWSSDIGTLLLPPEIVFWLVTKILFPAEVYYYVVNQNTREYKKWYSSDELHYVLHQTSRGRSEGSLFERPFSSTNNHGYGRLLPNSIRQTTNLYRHFHFGISRSVVSRKSRLVTFRTIAYLSMGCWSEFVVAGYKDWHIYMHPPPPHIYLSHLDDCVRTPPPLSGVATGMWVRIPHFCSDSWNFRKSVEKCFI